MTNYAKIKTKTAYLSNDFGESYARYLFGDKIINTLPRYIKGQRKGLLKGKLIWKKCTKGGWVKTGPYHDGGCGYVQAPGFISAVIEDNSWHNSKIIHKI